MSSECAIVGGLCPFTDSVHNPSLEERVVLRGFNGVANASAQAACRAVCEEYEDCNYYSLKWWEPARENRCRVCKSLEPHNNYYPDCATLWGPCAAVPPSSPPPMFESDDCCVQLLDESECPGTTGLDWLMIPKCRDARAGEVCEGDVAMCGIVSTANNCGVFDGYRRRECIES